MSKEMNFSQELQNVTKTKAEYVKSQEGSMRERWLSIIKHDIKYNAMEGNFKTVGTKKRISGFIDEISKNMIAAKCIEKKPIISSILSSYGTKYRIFKRVYATPTFINHLNLIKKDLEKEGLRVVKLSPAFLYNELIEKGPNTGNLAIANEYVYEIIRTKDNLTGSLYENDPFCLVKIYYEIEY